MWEDATTVADSNNEVMDDGAEEAVDTDHTAAGIVRHSITTEHYRLMWCEMAELTHDELDLVVTGQVMAGCFTGGETSARHGQQRGKTYMYPVFYHNGVRICKKTFLFLHCMSDKRFKSIKASYLANGLVARVHGNKGSSRITGLSLKEIHNSCTSKLYDMNEFAKHIRM